MQKCKYPGPHHEDLRGRASFWERATPGRGFTRSAGHCALRSTRLRNWHLMPLEILHGALVLFRGRARFEGAEIAALAGFRIHLSGIEPIFARLQFSDHGTKAS